MDISTLNICIPSPIEKVTYQVLEKKGIALDVKREDKIHPTISGNKWRKLKYNLQYALENKMSSITTFGGAFSNHIHATAAACKALKVPCHGIIRGEYDKNNPTIQFAQTCGMNLHFISRSAYREKGNSEEVQNILQKIGSTHLVPEGGSNELAFDGLKELAEEINTTKHNIILVSAGTGFTAAGVLRHLNPSKKLWVFSSLKSDYLHKVIKKNSPIYKHSQLRFISDFHFGGYGKVPIDLANHITNFKSESKIPIDPIYNGKMIIGFLQMIEQNLVDTSCSYLWIHTGGLQGIAAHNYLVTKQNKGIIL